MKAKSTSQPPPLKTGNIFRRAVWKFLEPINLIIFSIISLLAIYYAQITQHLKQSWDFLLDFNLLINVWQASTGGWLLSPEAGGSQAIGGCIQALVAIVGLWLVLRQLAETKRAARGDLIRQIGQDAQVDHYSDVIWKLEGFERSKTALNQLKLEPEEFKKFRGDARNFLRFCETITILLENALINQKEIFPLIGYRVLLATNSPWMRMEFLTKIHYYKDKRTKTWKRMHVADFRFCAIFALHERLTKCAEGRFRFNPTMLKLYRIDKRRDLRVCAWYDDAILYYHSHRRNPFGLNWAHIEFHWKKLKRRMPSWL